MKFIVFIALLISAAQANAENRMKEINMQSDGFNTYFVKSQIKGVGNSSLLVDTGSGYTTISHETLSRLQETGDAVYLRKLEGIMADGSRRLVSIYRIAGMNVGGDCYISNIEVAVFPTGSREILGLSALSKVSPFMFSMNPPRLLLSNCDTVAHG